jgi:hypothetical protein
MSRRAGQCRSLAESALAERTADEPVIVGAALAGGHDGLPDLVVRVRYENGAHADVIIDNGAGLRLMARCGAERIEALAGHSWREIRNALLEE